MKVTIQALDTHGHGVTRIEEQDVSVPFTLVGEQVEIQLLHPKRRQPWGMIENILTPNPERITPACGYFGQCGGCLLQHMPNETYQEFKQSAVLSTLQSNGLAVESFDETHFIPAHTRRRIDISGRMTDKGLTLGFHNIHSKRPFSVDSCAVLHPHIERLLTPLRQTLEGILQERDRIHVFFTCAEQGVDVMLAGLKRPLGCEDRAILTAFAESHSLSRFILKYNKKETLFERALPTVQFGGFSVQIAANGFLQASTEADQILASLVLQALPDSPQRIADLFCGRGTLSLPMVAAGHSVEGYECDTHALEALRKVEAPSLKLFNRDLFEFPLNVMELAPYDIVVLDPPRSGIKSQVLALGTAKIKRIIYVSCGPESFARDAAELVGQGYRLSHLALVDQFIWTPHAEVVGVFDRD